LLRCYRTAAAAFASWLDTAQQRRDSRVKLGAAVARLRNRLLASAWRAWADWTLRRVDHRRWLLPALARLNSRDLAAAYAGWLAAAAALRAKRLLGQKVTLC
jgi:hypothetical protein